MHYDLNLRIFTQLYIAIFCHFQVKLYSVSMLKSQPFVVSTFTLLVVASSIIKVDSKRRSYFYIDSLLIFFSRIHE